MFQPSDYPLGLGDLILRAKGRFYYLASPYTHDDPNVIENRVESAHTLFCVLTSFGLHIYNATYETHRAAHLHKLPTHFEFWKEHNSAFIQPGAGVIVHEQDGWEESRGVKHEIEEARTAGLPVYGMILVNPKNIVFTRELFHARPEAD